MSDRPNPAMPHQCPDCGLSMDKNAVAGNLCPRCLLKAGLDSGNQRSGGNGRFAFETPTQAQIKSEFPDLEILQFAGRGGMGVVFKVRQTKLNRTAALKILPPEIAGDPVFSARFEREAKALASLTHPNIVRLYEFGKTATYCYFLMEYVEGTNLREVIRSGELEPHEALEIVPQICEALQYAHSCGIVHRDIKPENILLDKTGQVKVADFGLAKMADHGHDVSLTGTQQVMGSLHYMAPEQINQTKSVDHRADLYSLGVVFYEMLTGELPIGRFAAPSTHAAMDRRLDNVVMRTLENEPDRRYQSAVEIKSEVESFHGHHGKAERFAEPTKAYRTSQLPQSSRSPSPPVKTSTEDARQRLQLPAILMSILGWFMVLLSVLAIMMVALLVGFAPGPSTMPPASVLNASLGSTNSIILAATPTSNQMNVTREHSLFGLIGLTLVPWPIVGIVLILAGRSMRYLKSYGLAVAGAVLAMLPITMFFPFSFVIGVWSLIVLNKSEVKNAFAN